MTSLNISSTCFRAGAIAASASTGAASAGPRPYDGYNLERLADDIRAVVTALQLKDFVLAGHSTGGAIAIKYVARYNGGGVSKLVLIDAAAPRGFTQETAAQLLKQTLNDRANMMLGVTNIFFFRYITEPFSIGSIRWACRQRAGRRPQSSSCCETLI